MIKHLHLLLLLLLVPSVAACSQGDRTFVAGASAYQRGDYDEAVNLILKAIEQGTQRYSRDHVLTSLGNAYNEQGRFDEAIAAHRQALEIDPKNHQAWVNLGIVHRLQGDYDEAERCYLKALDLAPDYPELYASLGALAIFQDEPEKAVKHLEHAVKLDATLAVTFGNLALAYAIVGRFDEADTTLKRAIVLGYKNAEIVRERIDALRNAEEP